MISVMENFSNVPNALQTVGYYEEVNPIGSYIKKHKLGCVFLSG